MRKEKNPIARAKAHKSFPVPVLQGLRMYLKIMKGGVSTKRTDKAINVVFWICFTISIALCLAAWVILYLDPVTHWLNISDNNLVFYVTVTTLVAAIYFYVYRLRKKQLSK